MTAQYQQSGELHGGSNRERCLFHRGHPGRARGADRRRRARGTAAPEPVSPGSPSRRSAVVFGDIGTSPVYTFRECFNPEHGLPLSPENVLGVLSLIVWALILVVAVKYVLLIMRADNQGEGGILALLALAQEAARSPRGRTVLVLVAIGGAALFLRRQHDHTGDFRVERDRRDRRRNPGDEPVCACRSRSWCWCCCSSFRSAAQRASATLFGPVMLVWFAVIGVDGLVQIAEAPRVLGGAEPGACHRRSSSPLR